MLRRVWLAGARGEASVRPRRAGSCQWLTNQRGVTYLILMFAIVLMGISLTIVGKQYDPKDAYDGHFVLFRNDSAQDDVIEFLRTGIENERPSLTE